MNIRCIFLFMCMIYQYHNIYAQKDSLKLYTRLYSGLNTYNNFQHNIEIGITSSSKSSDFGINIGKISDTYKYGMIKLNLLTVNTDKMMNEISFGVGKTNNQLTPNIFDMSTNILYNFNNYQVGIMYGYFNIFGENNISQTYFNLLLRIGLFNKQNIYNNPMLQSLRTRKIHKIL